MSDAFALENFAPPELVKFRLRKHGDHEFVVDGDPDTDDIALMLRIEEQMREAEAESDAVAAAAEGKQLLLRLIQEHQPDVTELRAGMQEVLIVFSLIVRGSSVAAAVAERILGPVPDGAATDGSTAFERDAASGGADEDGGERVDVPLVSASGSPERSSSSDELDAGRLAIGTA